MTQEQLSPGILLHGYDKKEAHLLHSSIQHYLSTDIILNSATNRFKQTVSSILDDTTTVSYQDDRPKILLFFGMDDQQIHQVLSHFPSELHRPIFCALTPHNINWEFTELMDHLLAEQEQMRHKNNDEA